MSKTVKPSWRFPITSAIMADVIFATSDKYFPLFFALFNVFTVALDASSFAFRISWLKFEPKVSNFPVLEPDGTDFSTRATVKSHFYYDGCL